MSPWVCWKTWDYAADSCPVNPAPSRSTTKLSVHSGSDKFSIYPAIRRALAKHGCGVHVKTAGTTWLEEVIGLAEAGGDRGRNVAMIECDRHRPRGASAEDVAHRRGTRDTIGGGNRFRVVREPDAARRQNSL